MTLGITPRQAEALNFIRSFIAEKGYSPSYAEIATAIGTTRGNAHAIVQRLRQRGAINCAPDLARSISVVEAA